MADTQAETIALSERSWLLYAPTFVGDPEAMLQRALAPGFPWERQPIRGKLTRRANAWFADNPRLIYRYSSQVWHPHKLSADMRSLMAPLRQTTGWRFNAVLAALYPDGAAGVDWHADDDFPFADGAPIATISLGETRLFRIRARGQRATVAEFDLPSGALLVMAGHCQQEFQHCVVKTSRPVGARVSLSYRAFTEPGEGNDAGCSGQS